ncbi:unnamed protein product, partial [Prorocentrum cordatum]
GGARHAAEETDEIGKAALAAAAPPAVHDPGLGAAGDAAPSAASEGAAAVLCPAPRSLGRPGGEGASVREPPGDEGADAAQPPTRLRAALAPEPQGRAAQGAPGSPRRGGRSTARGPRRRGAGLQRRAEEGAEQGAAGRRAGLLRALLDEALEPSGSVACLRELTPEVSLERESLLRLEVISQVESKFVVAQVTGRLLVVLDQHAASERVELERLQRQVLCGASYGL